jgi:hypothetical protein
MRELVAVVDRAAQSRRAVLAMLLEGTSDSPL